MKQRKLVLVVLLSLCASAMSACGKQSRSTDGNLESAHCLTQSCLCAKSSAEMGIHILKNTDLQTQSKESAVVTDKDMDETNGTEPDYHALEVTMYDYPADFVIGTNLQMAIEALSETNNFEVSEGWWEEDWWIDCFVSKYIQNSRRSFDYLNQRMEQKDGYINAEELAYIHYSLSGQMLDFSSYNSGEPVDAKASASFWSHNLMDSYTVEEANEDTVVLKMKILTLRDGDESYTQVWDYIVQLEKNPYSCFDGYSIQSIRLE